MCRSSYVRLTKQFCYPYDYRLLSYEYWIFDHISVIRYSVTAHAPCHVTSNRGLKQSTFLKSLAPICLFTFSLSGRYKTKIKPCYWRNSVCPIVKVVHCDLRMRSITWPVHRGSPKTTIFWHSIVYSLHNFYGATMTINDSLYWSIPMLKRFSAAKNWSPVKHGPQNGGFSDIERSKY